MNILDKKKTVPRVGDELYFIDDIEKYLSGDPSFLTERVGIIISSPSPFLELRNVVPNKAFTVAGLYKYNGSTFSNDDTYIQLEGIQLLFPASLFKGL